MKKIWNVYIAKRGRDNHLEKCLYYLNEANKEQKYEVNVFIGTDDDHSSIDWTKYENLFICWCGIECGEAFNKSKLLNWAIECSKSTQWQYMSIVDLDMCYPPDWFDRVNQEFESGVDYIVCHGWKLEEDTKEELEKFPSFGRILELNKQEFIVGPSQVSMTRGCLDIIQKHFPGKLYCEDFKGWGGEDSVLSSISRKLHSSGLVVKKEIDKIWAHQFHPEVFGNHPNYAENFSLYKKLHTEIMQKGL